MIDCDVHAVVDAVDRLLPYLPAHWADVVRTTGFRGPDVSAYPPGAPVSCAPQFRRADGAVEGSEVGHVSAVLDRWAADAAILTCDYAVESIRNPDAAAALASAANDWLVEEWLRADQRLLGSLVVPISQPALAAAEIERLGGDPRVVQVVLPVRSAAPYGDRRYLPVLEAADRHGLAVALQFGGSPGNPPTGTGWPSYYAEEHAGMAAVFQTQVTSLVAEGVLDRLPRLRVALLGSGFAWLPAFLWRFDKEWRGMRREIPWVRRRPTAYVEEHVRVALQPVDGPPDPAQLGDVLGDLPSEDLLMFSTDHPHWHFDSDAEAIPAGLSEGLLGKILDTNARRFYAL